MALFLAFTHGAAALAVWLTGLQWWAEGLLGLLVVMSGGRAFARHAFLTHPRAVVRLIWPAYGPWLLVRRDGTKDKAALRGDSYVHPGMVVLNFDLRPTGRTSVVLLPDSLDAEALRRLRVRLRISRHLVGRGERRDDAGRAGR